MARKKRRSKKFLDRLKNKYRLVVMNDDTFEEQMSFKLSRINLYAIISTIVIILVLVIVSTIIFTPLKEYIPGYADIELRRDLILQKLKTDSIEQKELAREKYMNNIKRIIEGNIDTTTYLKQSDVTTNGKSKMYKISYEDSLLRVEMESKERFNLDFDKRSNKESSISDFSFFIPLNGSITGNFDLDRAHFGIDIVAPENETIQAILDGTVILASWTLETGYIIGLQHKGDLVSFYKHNSVLLKKVGNFVNAGEAIAIIGSSGELSTGPHLHFELWEHGIPLNPKDYIVFD